MPSLKSAISNRASPEVGHVIALVEELLLAGAAGGRAGGRELWSEAAIETSAPEKIRLGDLGLGRIQASHRSGSLPAVLNRSKHQLHSLEGVELMRRVGQLLAVEDANQLRADEVRIVLRLVLRVVDALGLTE